MIEDFSEEGLSDDPVSSTDEPAPGASVKRQRQKSKAFEVESFKLKAFTKLEWSKKVDTFYVIGIIPSVLFTFIY